METSELILKINKSTNSVDIFSDISNWKKESRSILMSIHPDRCSLPGAVEATEKIISIINELEHGKKLSDDAGEVSLFTSHILIDGEMSFLKKSLDNYNKLMSYNDSHFSKYLPSKMEFDGNKLKVTSYNDKRFIPLALCPALPQEHLNWILNRMFEMCTWMNSIGYSHNGINPESIYVIPETHGIVCTSFYHMTKVDQKLNSLSGRFSNFYPDNIFTEKLARNYIDIECAKRTAIWLSGDKSCIGTSMRGKLNQYWLDFVLKFDDNPSTWEQYLGYDEMVKHTFERLFYPLNI